MYLEKWKKALTLGEVGGQTEGDGGQVDDGLLLGVGVDDGAVAEVVLADVGRLVQEAGEAAIKQANSHSIKID